MRVFVIAALGIATLVASMLVGYTQANAVVCARGVYRAGCAGPHGAVVVRRHPYYRYGY
jgi:hypothetical protein